MILDLNSRGMGDCIDKGGEGCSNLTFEYIKMINYRNCVLLVDTKVQYTCTPFRRCTIILFAQSIVHLCSLLRPYKITYLILIHLFSEK